MKTTTSLPNSDIQAKPSDPDLAMPNRFDISADGSEVTDNKTGRIWRRCPEGMTTIANACTGVAGSYTWDQAQALAKHEAMSTGKAWRLPFANELSSIVDMSVRNPAINTDIFPMKWPTPAAHFWSIEPAKDNSSFAWGVSFYDGKVDFHQRGDGGRVRLVCTGQFAVPINASGDVENSVYP
ncbi:MAG: DUF1566 domain-containing protein [Candidatus Nitrotoga sp.]